jgi:hypothetical protein
MDIERTFLSRKEGTTRRTPILCDLPPAQAGVAAALRRAFAPHSDEVERQFEELLQRLA